MKVQIIVLTCFVVTALNGMENVQQSTDKNKLEKPTAEHIVFCTPFREPNFDHMTELSFDQLVIAKLCEKREKKEIGAKHRESDFKEN